jgi:hypothetical protein
MCVARTESPALIHYVMSWMIWSLGAPTPLVCGHKIGFSLLFWTSRRSCFVSTIPSSGRGRMSHVGG